MSIQKNNIDKSLTKYIYVYIKLFLLPYKGTIIAIFHLNKGTLFQKSY